MGVKNVNLGALLTSQYELANRYLANTFKFKGLVFFISLVFILFPSLSTNNYASWIAFGLSVVVLYFDYYFLEMFKENYQLAESIRKLDLIRKIFPANHNKAEEAYVLSQIPQKFIDRSLEQPPLETEYYSDQNDKMGRLLEHIQENSFMTAYRFKEYAKELSKIIGLFLLLVLTTFIVGVIVIGDLGKSYSPSISQIIALIINIFFAFNLLAFYGNFNKKASQLGKIDKELEELKKQPDWDKIMMFFAEYNCILYDAYTTPDRIWKKHQNTINLIWERRVNSD